MKLTLSIPDDLYDLYVQQAGDKEGVKSFIVDRLDRFKDHEPKARITELTEAQRARLHELFDRTIATGDDIIRAVEDIVRFDLGEFAYDFKVEDLEILAQQAEYWDKSLPEYIHDTMDDYVKFATNQA